MTWMSCEVTLLRRAASAGIGGRPGRTDGSSVGPDQGPLAGDRDLDTGNHEYFGIGSGVLIRHSAGPSHEIDHDFIRHANDDVVADVGIEHVGRRVIGKDGEAAPHRRDVRRVVVHEEIDVLREPRGAMGDHPEATDQEIARPGFVEGAADPDDVVRLRRACVRAIVRVIHASASSKLSKRKTPRGIRQGVPLSEAAVRAIAAWSDQPCPSGDRRPTVRMRKVSHREVRPSTSLSATRSRQ